MPPIMRVSVFHATEPGTLATIDHASCLLDDGNLYPATLEDGRLRFTFPDGTVLKNSEHGGWHGLVAVDTVEGQHQDFHVELAPDVDLQMEPYVVLPTLLPLVVSGKFFVTSDGRPFTVIETSEFNLLARYLVEGWEALMPVIEQRRDLGFNSLRAWTAFNIPLIGTLIPSQHDRVYARLRELVDWLGAEGFYTEVTAFTGPYSGVLDGDNAKVAHWDGVKAALAGASTLLALELVNEGDNAPNRDLPWGRLQRPESMLVASHGSNIQDASPIEPVWSVTGYRSPTHEWWRKVGHNAMEFADKYGVPCWTNEYPRVPDADDSLTHMEDAAAAATLLCVGSCFHSPNGKTSQLFVDRERDLAEAFVRGARSIDPKYQRGAYRRHVDPAYLRVYSRTLPDGDSAMVRIRN